MKTLVIGCTGVIGSWIIDGLADKGEAVRCMSRSWAKIRDLPDGMERIAADLDRPHTLADAFSGADKVFLLVPVSRSETDQGLNAVEAARKAGVKKIVYLSVFMPSGSEIIPYFSNKIPVENAVMDSGMEYTILRPNNFFQNDVSVIGVVTAFGIYPTPFGLVGLNRVDVRDVADCAVNALTKKGHEGNIYSLHGPDRLTGRDTARIYSRHVGRDVRYAGNDLDYWIRHVKKIMPEWLYLYLRLMYQYIQNYGMIATEEELKKQSALLGHQPRSFDSFGKELSSEWKRALALSG
jgi:uncharacterized protein YbjT (DUF2867 family)